MEIKGEMEVTGLRIEKRRTPEGVLTDKRYIICGDVYYATLDKIEKEVGVIVDKDTFIRAVAEFLEKVIDTAIY